MDRQTDGACRLQTDKWAETNKRQTKEVEEEEEEERRGTPDGAAHGREKAEVRGEG